MYITDLLLWNSKHKSNNVMILEETINEICNCKFNTNVKVAKLSAYSIKVMPLFYVFLSQDHMSSLLSKGISGRMAARGISVLTALLSL